MSNWAIWVNLVGQIITAIAKIEGEPVDKIRQRLLTDPRISSTASDDAASVIETSMPVDGSGTEGQG